MAVATPPRHDVHERIHVPALDGVRGIAVLLVILHHARVFTHGWIGVDLFFVLSGYLITGILIRAKQRPHYYRNFIARRALRIFPPCYAFLALTIIALPIARHDPLPPNQWWVWSYLTNIKVAIGGYEAVPPPTGHLWSVAIEEQFYLLWPVVVLMCSRETLRRVCAWGIAIAFTLRVGLHLSPSDSLASYVLMPTRVDALLIGAVLAVEPSDGWIWRPKFAMPLGAAVLAVAVAVLAGRDPHDRLIETIGYSVLALTAAALIVLARTNQPIARLLSWRPLRLAGKYSYAAYLWHPFVMVRLRTHFQLEGVSLAAAGMIVTFTIAVVSWYIFESPILALKRYFPEPAVHSMEKQQAVA